MGVVSVEHVSGIVFGCKARVPYTAVPDAKALGTCHHFCVMVYV